MKPDTWGCCVDGISLTSLPRSSLSFNVKAQAKSFAPQLTNAIAFFTAEFAAGLIGVIPFILGSDGEIYLLSAVSVRCGCQAWAKPKEVQSNYTNPRCPSLFASELRNRFLRFYRWILRRLSAKSARHLSCRVLCLRISGLHGWACICC